MPRLIETFARQVGHAPAGTAKYWDTEIKGFVLFVGKRTKTWYFQKDIGGQTNRVLIGRYPTISAAAARQTALGLSLEMSRGAGRTAQAGIPTLEAAMNAYLARPRLRSETHKKGTRTQLSLHLKDWLKRPLDEVTRPMVVSRHQELAATPVAANHTLRKFRTIWNHARRTVDLPECPTMAIEWYEERPDGRTIGDLVAWRDRVGEVQNPVHAAFYWLLLYTGLRKTEAITLEWKQVLPDRIHLPMTKNGRSFDLPLVARHHEILEPLRRHDRRWVFPSPQSSTGHVKGPEVLPWSPHAHRRTFATVALEAGILEEIVGRLLNHTPMSVTGQRYALPSLDALRPAMQSTCDELDRRLGWQGGVANRDG